MKFLKGAIIFACGSGIGFGVGVVLTRNKYEDKFNSEMSEMRQHYQEKLNGLEEKIDIAESRIEADEIIKKEGYVSYDRMNETEVRDRVKTIIEKAVNGDRPPEDYPDEPFVITEEDFSERELYFEKIECDYYLGDGALVDEADELLNIDDTIGYDNLESFINSDESVMYIRNAHLSTDYLVTKIGGSYSEIIGVGGDDEE